MAYIYRNTNTLPVGTIILFNLGPVQSYNNQRILSDTGTITSVHFNGYTVMVRDVRVLVKFGDVRGIAQ